MELLTDDSTGAVHELFRLSFAEARACVALREVYKAPLVSTWDSSFFTGFQRVNRRTPKHGMYQQCRWLLGEAVGSRSVTCEMREGISLLGLAIHHLTSRHGPHHFFLQQRPENYNYERQEQAAIFRGCSIEIECWI